MIDEDEFDLDFTKPPRNPPKPPPPQKVESARREASESHPHLTRVGFYVAMARRPRHLVVPHSGKHHHILVIDDDEAILKLVGEVLEKEGFIPRFARNRAEIKVVFNTPPVPDLVLLDVGLPDTDGFSVLERIRCSRKVAHLPVIMMTGKAEVTDIARGLSLGADGYVTKPFRISGLLSAVRTVLALD